MNLLIIGFGTLSRGDDRGAEPRRVVSFNLCADQLVLALADAEQIAGLSPYAADPDLSVMAREARGFPRLDWHAEATIAAKPDLVLVGPSDRPTARRLLAAQGVRVFEVELITDIAAAKQQITAVALMLGHPDRGQNLIGRIEQVRARLAEAPRPRVSTALLLERGGYVAGRTSLAAALLAEIGWRPPAGAPAGYGGFVALENLILMHPDVLLLNGSAALVTMHPAITALYPARRRIELPARLTLCGGPGLLAALEYVMLVLTRL